MMRNRLIAVLLVAWFIPAVAQGATGKAELHVRQIKGAEQRTVVIPGRLISYTFRGDGAGGRTVFLLTDAVRPDEPTAKDEKPDKEQPGRAIPPCESESSSDTEAVFDTNLYRFDPTGHTVERLRDDLPHDATAIEAFDIDGDGRDELVLARPGQLLELVPRAGAPLRPLLEQEGYSWASLHPRAIRRPHAAGRPWTSSISLGTLAVYGPQDTDDRWRERVRVELPLEARVDDGRIRVWSQSPRSIGQSADGTYYFATSPDDSSRSRVQTTLIQASDGGESSVIDCWAHLPEPEEVLGSDFLMLDDQPVLLVTTKPADKLNLFGEQRLRLYPLRRDRSRLGLLPLFATDTRMNLWQDGTPMLFDADDDGRDDLVIGYWKGILKDRVVLDAYIRQEDGQFGDSARTTAFDVKKGDRSFVVFGNDLTGDGLADLLIRGKPGLIVYPGRESKTGKNLVEDRPRTIKLFGSGKNATEDEMFYTSYTDARPLVVDLDGDGVYEILLLERGSKTRPTRFDLIRLTD